MADTSPYAEPAPTPASEPTCGLPGCREMTAHGHLAGYAVPWITTQVLPLPASPAPTEEADLAGLARVIDPAIYPDINRLTGDGWAASKRAASAILRSRWLATHDEWVRADERARIERERAAAAEAERIASEPCDSEADTWSTLRLDPNRYDRAWLRCKKVGPHDVHEDADYGFTWGDGVEA